MSTFSKEPVSTQQKSSSATSVSKNDNSPFVQNHALNPILYLQHTVGNREVQKILFSASPEMNKENELVAGDLAYAIHI